MTEADAAEVDVRHNRRDAARQREHEARFRYRPPPVRQGMPGGPRGDRYAAPQRMDDFDPSYDAKAPEVLPGLRWGRTPDDEKDCTERHVEDAVKLLPQLQGLRLADLKEDEVTPYELAQGLKRLRAQPPGIVRTTHVAYLMGIIRATRRKRAFDR